MAAKKKSSASPTSRKPTNPRVKEVVDAVFGGRAGLRTGSMFGCPGWFAGSTAVVCVRGDDTLLTLPQPRIDELVKKAGYALFEAMGRTMSGWLMLDEERVRELAKNDALAEEAIAHALAKAKAKAKAKTKTKTKAAAAQRVTKKSASR